MTPWRILPDRSSNPIGTLYRVLAPRATTQSYLPDANGACVPFRKDARLYDVEGPLPIGLAHLERRIDA